MIIAGTAIPATNAMPTGAPTNVPSCHNSFFLRDHGFLPQNVHPEGLDADFKNSFIKCVRLRSKQVCYLLPQIVEIAYLFHAKPTEFRAANCTHHVIA